jgi:hypothetical protein
LPRATTDARGDDPRVPPVNEGDRPVVAIGSIERGSVRLDVLAVRALARRLFSPRVARRFVLGFADSHVAVP